MLSKLTANFIELAANNKLHHAYLFFGENMSEIKKFTNSLANLLENGKFEESEGMLTDVFFIENSGSSIGIEIVREIKNFLWQKPLKSAKRAAIIFNAENLTNEAQNAILKITEDPPESALVILTIKNSESLLPTILSRLQKVYFGTNRKAAPQIDDRVKKLVADFLNGGAREKQAIVKQIVEDEREEEIQLALPFLDGLILSLSENKLKNASLLKQLFERKRLMEQYSLNKRLQLAFLAQIWYN